MKWTIPRERLTDDEQLDELLVRGTWDWIQPADIIDVARFSGPPDDDALIEQAISLVTSLLERGWAVAGDIVAGQHVPWTVSSDAAHHRIAALWRHDHDSAVGYDVWLDPTEPGIARGEALVKREEGLVEWVSPARAALQRRGDRGASETPRPPEDPRAGSLDNAPAD